jgi:hypothetical protein
MRDSACKLPADGSALSWVKAVNARSHFSTRGSKSIICKALESLCFSAIALIALSFMPNFCNKCELTAA